jgi:hypothetical protein
MRRKGKEVPIHQYTVGRYKYPLLAPFAYAKAPFTPANPAWNTLLHKPAENRRKRTKEIRSETLEKAASER